MALEGLRSTMRRFAPVPVENVEGAMGPEPAAAPSGLSGAAPVSAPAAFAPVDARPVAADPTVDGGVDAVAFGCPSCGRTIARGARRCDGCGQRLVLDVPLNRAFALGGSGAIGGVLIGILVMTILGPAARPAVAGSQASDPTSGNPAAGGVATGVVPAGASAALRGTTELNGRLAAEAAPLAAALRGKSLKTTDVVLILRRLSVDARTGQGMMGAFGAWPDAAMQQAALTSFYEDLGSRINAGLAVSVRNGSAYRKAAKAVLAVLRRIPALDADARALGSAAGIDLPRVVFPEAIH
jgi:hypothetical protein